MTLLLVRHAKAGSRAKWAGDDHDRPLSPQGVRQAAGLAVLLGDYRIRRIITSPYLRCLQTVEPLAREVGCAIEEDDALAEGADVGPLVRLTHDLIRTTAVLCTHGDIVPALLDALVETDRLRLHGPARSAKGSTWVLEPRRGRYATALYLPPPA